PLRPGGRRRPDRRPLATVLAEARRNQVAPFSARRGFVEEPVHALRLHRHPRRRRAPGRRSHLPARRHHLRQRGEQDGDRVASAWRAVPDHLLDFKPHEKTNPIRTILVHQLLSERRFFAQFVGTEEPPVEELLPAGDKPTVSAYLDKYIGLTRRRLPQLAQGTAAWWLGSRPFF